MTQGRADGVIRAAGIAAGPEGRVAFVVNDERVPRGGLDAVLADGRSQHTAQQLIGLCQPGEQTLLIRAADEILGTHTSEPCYYLARPPDQQFLLCISPVRSCPDNSRFVPS